MSSAQKTVIRSIVTSALQELADPAYQQRVWITGSPTEVSSLNEAAAALFNDSGLDDALEKNAVTFSPEVDLELRELRVMLRSCLGRQSSQTTQELISSPEWGLLREKAARLWRTLMTQA